MIGYLKSCQRLAARANAHSNAYFTEHLLELHLPQNARMHQELKDANAMPSESKNAGCSHSPRLPTRTGNISLLGRRPPLFEDALQLGHQRMEVVDACSVHAHPSHPLQIFTQAMPCK